MYHLYFANKKNKFLNYKEVNEWINWIEEAISEKKKKIQQILYNYKECFSTNNWYGDQVKDLLIFILATPRDLK
jgi:hypothetical protein